MKDYTIRKKKFFWRTDGEYNFYLVIYYLMEVKFRLLGVAIITGPILYTSADLTEVQAELNRRQSEL